MRKNLPPQPSRTALLEQCEHAPEQAVDLLQLLWEKLEEQQIQIEKQTKEIAKLKAKLSLNSRNSSKPPSTDKSNPGGGAPKKKDSNPGRRKGPKRKPGAQKGHKGSTLEQTLHPDFRVELEAPKKCNCGEDLSDLPACGKQVRQILDLPENIKIQTTEYQAPVCLCPSCGLKNVASFPPEVSAPVQYGSRIRAISTYLHAYHLIPYERLGEIFKDLFNCPISTGALTGFIQKSSACAEPLHERIYEEIMASEFMHNDETGLNIAGDLSWLHTASTPEYAYFKVTQGRTFEDIKSVGVFEDYAGRSIHDFLRAYLKFDSLLHGLCNAHHLRELTYIEEELKQPWAKEMSELLLRIKDQISELPPEQKLLEITIQAQFREAYRAILKKGHKSNPPPKRKPGQRGRLAKGKSLNLLERFENYEEEALAFMIYGVPFDNNEAERDLRMMKTRQKISGCFRSLEWANNFAKIRSIITSAKKKSVDIYQLLQATLTDPKKAQTMLFAT
jgi:transposase